MSNVIPIRGAGAKTSQPIIASPPAQEEGSIKFTVDGDSSQMHITGAYEKRLQFAAFTMIKGLSALADKIAASGTIGHFSEGPVHESLPIKRRRLPKRLDENSDFGAL